jgi:AcrR family transcriptional regulator
MTLYRHFGSKDDLILEYLNDKGRKADEVWADIEAASPGDPVGQLYDYVGQRVIEEFKIRQRQRLEALCEAAGATEPGLLADALVLLIEGARVSRRSVGSEGPSANLVGSGKAVIAAFGVRPQRPTSSTY